MLCGKSVHGRVSVFVSYLGILYYSLVVLTTRSSSITNTIVVILNEMYKITNFLFAKSYLLLYMNFLGESWE